ncbi:MAG: VPLPA-CTERM sorting domain-containing protein [Methylococcales bacterium]
MKLRLFGSMGASIFTLFTLLTILLVSISNVNASMVTFRFEGEIIRVDNELSSAFSEGEQFTGTYTFDSEALPDGVVFPGEGGVSYLDAISAMSFTSGNYRASSVSGSVFIDLESFSGLDYFVNFQPPLGLSVGGFSPTRMGFLWTLNEFIQSVDRLPTEPLFDPNLPFERVFADEFEHGDIFDANGNPLTEALFLENPDQPVFNPDGTLIEFRGDGFMRFTFVDADQQEASSFGHLTSVTVVPIPAAAWLFGTGLLGLISFTKRRQLA